MKGPYIYGSHSLDEVAKIVVAINTFTGHNETERDMVKALKLAKDCPSLQWLLNAFAGRGIPDSLVDIFAILIAYTHSGYPGWEYAHGLVVSFQYFENVPKELTEIAAQAGCPLSQEIMYEKTLNSYWLELGSKMGWPMAQCQLGTLNEDISLIRKSAKANCLAGMFLLAESLDRTDLEKWYWICKVRQLDDVTFGDLIDDLIHDPILDPMCLVGYMCPDIEEARQIYEAHCTFVKEGIDAWSLCALRIGICKDIRILIGQIIWKHRVYLGP